MRFSLIGWRFGRLVVVADTGERRARKKVFLCRCDCGHAVKVVSTNLTRGYHLSCGCYRSDVAAAARSGLPKPKLRSE